MTQTAEKARVPARVEQEREQRRRRDDLGLGRQINLGIVGKVDPDYQYRFINDDPGRVHQLTVMDDWDIVTTEDLGESHAKDRGVGTPVERVVDKRSGKRAILVRKRKDYYSADKAKEQGKIDETEKAMRRGHVKSPEGLADGGDANQAYVPRGGISIQSPKSSSYTP